MIELQVSEQTAALLQDPLLGEGDVDAKIRCLLAGEYLRQLSEARAVDQRLAQKYQTAFADFFERRTTVQHGNSWEVEKDATDWANAVSAIKTWQEKLKAVEELTHGAP